MAVEMLTCCTVGADACIRPRGGDAHRPPQPSRRTGASPRVRPHTPERQTAPAARFAPICAAYSTTPSRTLPSSSPPTQPMTNPGPEQHPKICSRTASRREILPASYSCPANLAHTAYPPTQESTTAWAASADSNPSTRCKGRSSAAGGGAAISSSHTTKKGNSAGSTLSRQSAVPLANPCFAACGSASTNTPSTAAAAAVKKRRFLQTFILRTSPRILD